MQLIVKDYLEHLQIAKVSSHHFVREGQEPALLIADAEADDQIMSILEWSPLIMVTASALPKVVSWGIRIDAVFINASGGQPDEPMMRASLALADAGEIIRFANGLPEAVASYLGKRSERGVQVIIKTPGNHLKDWELDRELSVTLIDPAHRWSRITSGHYEKWMPGNSLLNVHGTSPMKVSGGELTDGVIRTGRDGIVTIKSSAMFWVGETLAGVDTR